MFRRLCLWLLLSGWLSGAFLAVPGALYALTAVMDGACYASGAAFLLIGGAASGWISYNDFSACPAGRRFLCRIFRGGSFMMSRAARLKPFPGALFGVGIIAAVILPGGFMA